MLSGLRDLQDKKMIKEKEMDNPTIYYCKVHFVVLDFFSKFVTKLMSHKNIVFAKFVSIMREGFILDMLIL